MSAQLEDLSTQTASQLQQRLEKGWDVIEAARLRGEDIQAFEAHWLRLLQEYERRCQQEAP